MSWALHKREQLADTVHNVYAFVAAAPQSLEAPLWLERTQLCSEWPASQRLPVCCPRPQLAATAPVGKAHTVAELPVTPQLLCSTNKPASRGLCALCCLPCAALGLQLLCEARLPGCLLLR